jgi:hypothetical protein
MDWIRIAWEEVQSVGSWIVIGRSLIAIAIASLVGYLIGWGEVQRMLSISVSLPLWLLFLVGGGWIALSAQVVRWYRRTNDLPTGWCKRYTSDVIDGVGWTWRWKDGSPFQLTPRCMTKTDRGHICEKELMVDQGDFLEVALHKSDPEGFKTILEGMDMHPKNSMRLKCEVHGSQTSLRIDEEDPLKSFRSEIIERCKDGRWRNAVEISPFKPAS